MSDETTLLPCAHCGCDTPWLEDIEHTQGLRWYVFCPVCGATGGQKRTRAEAIAAWNARTLSILSAKQVREAIEHHGTASLGCRWQFTDRNLQAIADELNALLGSEPSYDELLRCLENDWNIRARWDGLRKFWCIELTEEGVWMRDAACGTLTAEQVREAVMSADRWEKPMGNTGLTNTHLIIRDDGWQAIADELNSELGSDAKPCYAADENYKRCKYSVNRGWCDDAPFLVWDDTGHLFITMGGLKTWDVTDDAKKWFAELGSGTCKITATATNDFMYPDYMTKWYELSCGHSLTLKGDEAPKWCAVCGKAVER